MVIQCSQCQECFTRQSSLDRHTLSKHNVHNATHYCNLCSKPFARRDNLKRHQQIYHNNSDVANPPVVAESSTAGSSRIVNSLNGSNSFARPDESMGDGFVFDDNSIDTIDPTWWLSDNVQVDDDLLLGPNVVDTNRSLPSSAWGVHGQYIDPKNLIKDNQQGTGAGNPYWSATADRMYDRKVYSVPFDTRPDSVNTASDARRGNTFDVSSSLPGSDSDMRPTNTWYYQPG